MAGRAGIVPSLLATFSSLSLSQTQSLATALAPRLRPGDTLTLAGEVGSGKTAFARALIGAIAIGAPEVTSPTFTLMQSYEVATGLLWHLDLYRIHEEKELESLGLEELWPHIVLMEWPAIAGAMLPADKLDIAFAYGPRPEARTLAFHGNDAWRARLEGVI